MYSIYRQAGCGIYIHECSTSMSMCRGGGGEGLIGDDCGLLYNNREVIPQAYLNTFTLLGCGQRKDLHICIMCDAAIDYLHTSVL